MKRNDTVTPRNRRDDKCRHAAHARRDAIAPEARGYHNHHKAHDRTCPHCGRTTRPNMFVCPHCGAHLAIPRESISQRAVQAEMRIGTALRSLKQRGARKFAVQPAPQKRQRYMTEEATAKLAATVPAVA